MKIKLKKSKDRKWFFVLTARNGKILMTSETYNKRSSALKTIAVVVTGEISL